MPSKGNQNQIGFELELPCAYKLAARAFITNSNHDGIARHHLHSGFWITLFDNTCVFVLLLFI